MTGLTTHPGGASLLEACARFGLDAGAVRPIGGYESLVFEAPPGILRLTSSRSRSREEVAAELEWVWFLAEAGVPVARPARAPAEALHAVEATDGDGYFTAVLFERAPGRPFGPDDWSPDTARRWGELLAGMHALARDYTPALPHRRRPWREDVRFRPEDFVPATEDAFYQAWRALCARLEDLPTDADHYGLIHADVGPENMMVGEGARAITLFDFADSIYSWFAHDLACSLVEARYFARASGCELPSWFLPALLDGYRGVRPLSPAAERWIEAFVELQELERFIARFRVSHG